MSELSVPLRPACLKDGHPCVPPPPSVSSYSSHSHPLSPSSPPPSSFIIHPPHPSQAGLRADVQTLSFRLGPHCQLRALLSLSLVACPGSFFLLSPSSRGQIRPYKATFLLIHFCQFQRCHSHHCSGEGREAELAASLAARTVLFGLSRGDVSAARKTVIFVWSRCFE